MGWPVKPLPFFLARRTRNQLTIRQIEFLKVENEILRGEELRQWHTLADRY